MQNCYNLLYREEEVHSRPPALRFRSSFLICPSQREMMPTLENFGVGSIPWSPLARGLLTRPWAPKAAGEGTKRENTDEWLAIFKNGGDADAAVVNR